jgi:hypothetical protein
VVGVVLGLRLDIEKNLDHTHDDHKQLRR